jgi:acyl-CoA reductase-like NAD-dependent aldehyde dehydrogenase
MEPFLSCNPTTGETVGTFPTHSAGEVSAAVEQARIFAGAWRQRPVRERCRLLRRWRARLVADADGLAETVSAEIGKPLQESWGADLLPSLTALRWLENETAAILRPRRAGGARLTAAPYGVVGVIGTWNYPLLLNVAPIAWALAAGNGVVFKPSEFATASALRLMAHAEAVGLPVVTVTGGCETGQALCRSAIDKLAFTGGVRTGRTILADLAARNTPAVMELSGNDAFVVCADADIPLAARSAVWGRVCNAGQSCIAPQRFYVVQERAEAFLEACQRELESLQPGVDFGPMRTERLRDTAHRLVWQAIAQGAELRAGGRCMTEMPGFHYAPTLLAACTDSMPVVQQDFFGPVLPVCTVRNVEEAIQRIQAGDMALGVSLWTRNVKQGEALAARLDVGLAAVNQDTLLLGAKPALPFGGLRASGFGKQRGIAGLEEFVHWKVTAAARSGGERRHLFPYRPATLPILRGLLAFQNAPTLRTKLEAVRRLTRAAADYQKQNRQD